MSDQHRSDAWDSDDTGKYFTPHLRALADRGTQFDRAWTQSPVCQPSRASLITGLYPTDHGLVRNNDHDFDAGWPTFMKALQTVGYRTANIGKTHYLGSKEVDSLTERLRAQDWVTDIADFGFNDVVEEFDQHVHKSPGFESPYLDYLDERDLRERYLSMIECVMPFTEGHWKGIASSLPEGADHSDFLTDTAVNWISVAPSDAPLFLQLSYVQPHSPLIASPRWRGHYVDQIPPRERGEPAVGQTGRWEEHLADLRIRSQTHRLTDVDYMMAEESYRGMISMIDEGIGRVVSALEQRGIAENTWIFYTSDHGEMMGDHGLMGKACFYRGAVEVPLIVSPPPTESPQTRSVKSIVQLVDVPATILDIAGAPALPSCRGKSLRRTVSEDTLPDADGLAVSEIGSYGTSKTVFRALSDGVSRLTIDLYNNEHCEIFNLGNDPLEQQNLLGSREGRHIAADLVDRAHDLFAPII